MTFSKLSILAILFLIFTSMAYGQVGVGTPTPHSSAQLDVNSTTKGFLVPRMTYSQRTNISSPTTGLLVYQTDSYYSYLTGFWYYNGTDWMPLGYSTFYITTPSVSGGNSFFGSQAGTTSSYQNSGFGYQALTSNSGYQNTAFGYRGLYQNSTGYQNTVLGSNAGYSNMSGYQNTFIGYNSNPSTSGLLNATAIGAGSQVSANNTIQLGNTSVTNVNTSGTVTSNGFIKSGGTSSQFLMADGSATSSPSLSTATALPLSTGVTGTLPIANGGTGVTTSTGSGNNVLSTSPTLTTPIISTTTNSSSAGAVRYNSTSGNIEFSNGSIWKTLASVEVDNSYKLVSTGVASVVNTSQDITTGSYNSLNNSSITVTVPSGFSDVKVILQWNVWGDVQSNSTSNHIAGSIRYQISQSGQSTNVYGSVMMTGWFGFIGTGGSYASTRYSAPVSYILTNLPPGTYSFLLQMSREAEVGPISSFRNWGIAGTGQVFAR